LQLLFVIGTLSIAVCVSEKILCHSVRNVKRVAFQNRNRQIANRTKVQENKHFQKGNLLRKAQKERALTSSPTPGIPQKNRIHRNVPQRPLNGGRKFTLMDSPK